MKAVVNHLRLLLPPLPPSLPTSARPTRPSWPRSTAHPSFPPSAFLPSFRPRPHCACSLRRMYGEILTRRWRAGEQVAAAMGQSGGRGTGDWHWRVGAWWVAGPRYTLRTLPLLRVDKGYGDVGRRLRACEGTSTCSTTPPKTHRTRPKSDCFSQTLDHVRGFL